MVRWGTASGGAPWGRTPAVPVVIRRVIMIIIRIQLITIMILVIIIILIIILRIIK